LPRSGGLGTATSVTADCDVTAAPINAIKNMSQIGFLGGDGDLHSSPVMGPFNHCSWLCQVKLWHRLVTKRRVPFGSHTLGRQRWGKAGLLRCQARCSKHLINCLDPVPHRGPLVSGKVHPTSNVGSEDRAGLCGVEGLQFRGL
jgi:hypothetical protein